MGIVKQLPTAKTEKFKELEKLEKYPPSLAIYCFIDPEDDEPYYITIGDPFECMQLLNRVKDTLLTHCLIEDIVDDLEDRED